MCWPGSMRGGGRKALFQGRRNIDHGRSAELGRWRDFVALPLGFYERPEPFFKIVALFFRMETFGQRIDELFRKLDLLWFESLSSTLALWLKLFRIRSKIRAMKLNSYRFKAF
jgi:hypothetical protein